MSRDSDKSLRSAHSGETVIPLLARGFEAGRRDRPRTSRRSRHTFDPSHTGRVQLITGSPAGIGGFIDKFRSADLGSQVASWLGRTDASLTAAEVESALGSSALGRIAGRLGLGGSGP